MMIHNASLDHLWLEQLLREHADICFQYRIDLAPPILELSNSRSRMGCWLPKTGILRISRRLITAHAWNVVLMVLKHEMAHQVCSEIFLSPEQGHGPDFRRACELLGVLPPYNRAGGDLAEVVSRPASDPQTRAGRRTLERVNKLLSLAGSDNEHEAALAMQRATEIMHRHNLDTAALDHVSRTSCLRLTINTRSRQMPSYRRAICAILRDYFFVQVICATVYDPEKDTCYKTVELLGRSENVPVAAHCYHFLEQQLASLWEKNRKKFRGHARTARNSYYLGLLHGFSRKLAEQAKRCTTSQPAHAEAATSALVVAADTAVQEFTACHFPRLSRRRARKVRILGHPYAQAVKTGRQLVLHASLSERKQGTGVLENS
jgi:hypothetical protein